MDIYNIDFLQMTKKQEALNKARESGKKIIAGGKEAMQGSSNIVKGTSKSLRNVVKGSYHLVDAGDKAIGEKIEKKQMKDGEYPGKVGKFLRDNIMKLTIALSALGVGGYEAIDSLSDNKGSEEKIEIKHIDMPEEEQFLSNFMNSPDVLKDLKSSGKSWQDKRENRYLGKDEARNNMRNGFGEAERKKVIEGMCRMIESGHLEMVLKKADEAGVPRQCAFLALAESGWQAGANSGVAGGYWQFTKSSARLFGLIDKDGNDYRSDPEKSTDAAMKHLKENYGIVCNYAKQLGYALSESDKWILAFHMYNGSPNLVRNGMIACKGNVNEYSKKLKELVEKNGGCIIVRGKKIKVNAEENGNYVPRILAIQNALQKIFDENGYDVDKIRSIYLDQNFIKTNADLMHQNFVKNEKNMSNKEKVKKLKEIKTQYTEEYKLKMISKAYYEGAIRIIDDEISSYE